MNLKNAPVLTPLLLLILLTGSTHGEVRREASEFVLTGRGYEARVSVTNGLLTRLSIGGAPAIDQMAIRFTELRAPRIAVSQAGADQVAVRVSGEDARGATVENAYALLYEAAPDRFFVKVQGTIGRVCGHGPRFVLTPTAQAIRSLEHKELIALPALSGRTPWMKVKVHYANGATLGILNSGAGNPFNANENGQIHGLTYGRANFVANSQYVYEMIPERGARPAPGAPPMQVAEAATPAVYWEGDPAAATLQFPREHLARIKGRPGLRLKTRIEDAFEQEVANEEQPFDLSGEADPLVVKVPLKVPGLGWYRAFFTVNDKDGTMIEGTERLIFSVLRRLPNMGERFDNQIQTDYTIGLGLMRDSIHGKSRPAELIALASNHQAAAAGTDVNVSYQIDSSPVGNDPAKFAGYIENVFSKAGPFIPAVEIINEPNGNYQPKEYIDTFLRPAFETMRRVSPGTRILGPVLCGIAPEQARYLEELYKLGLKDLTHELTFHPYAGNFDDGHGVASMRRLAEIIAANGDSAKPIHFTEAGYFHNGWNNVASLREIIKLAVAQYAWQNAVLGIDHRHNFYYFTDSMGYYDMWLRSRQLTPAAVALRNYTSLVKGQDRPRVLDFGMHGAVRAFLYPGRERQVVLLWAAGNHIPAGVPDPAVGVRFSCSEAPRLMDCFGNERQALRKEKRNLYSLQAGTYPQYLLLPPGATFEPVVESWGANLALSSGGALAEASAEEGTAPAISVLDGNTTGATAWRSAEDNVFPQTLTVSLASPAQVNRIAIWGYSPRGYDLEALAANGAWQRLASVRDESFRRYRALAFDPVQTDTLRLTILDSHTPRAEIAEFEVYGAGDRAATAAELVNWAAAANGATAAASSELVKEATVAEQDYGAKEPRITKVTLAGRAANAIDGKRLVGNWRDFFPTTWMAATNQPLPQWLEVRFDRRRPLNSVTVYTVAFARWTPETSGIRDWDVEAWDGKAWQTVDRVTGNTRVSKVSRFRQPVTTDRIRILVKGTNDDEGTIGIMEVEAFGPK